MKKILTFLCLIVFTSNYSFGDVFASQIKFLNPDGKPFDGKFSDGTGIKISYNLNDTATSVIVQIFDGINLIATLTANNQSLGENFINWNGQGTTPGKSYKVKFLTTQKTYSSTNYTVTQMIKTYESKSLYTRGCDAQRNPAHPNFGFIYASNSDPGSEDRLKTGITRWTSSGNYAGTFEGHPILFSSLGNTHAGGSIDWGTASPWYATLDADGSIYATSNGSGKIFKMLNDSTAPYQICSGRLYQPRGIYVSGTGANKTIYIAADTNVYRAKFTTGDTLGNLELVATLGNYIRDLLIDDDGFLIVGLRNGPTGAAGGAIERFDLSGSFPKKRVDAMWSITLSSHSVIGLALKHGANLTNTVDDTLYISTRDGNEPGIHEITLINEFFPTIKYVLNPGLTAGSLGGNISANADLTLDYANNIILFENGNEEIFMISPPSTSETKTISVDANKDLVVLSSTIVDEKIIKPNGISLNQNFPNPFNPVTNISYTLNTNGFVELEIYNSLGQKKETLFNGFQQSGFHQIKFDGKNYPSGIYYYRIKVDGNKFVDTKKMILSK